MQLIQRRRSALARVLKPGEDADAEAVGRLTPERKQGAVDGNDRVSTRRGSDRADTAAGQDTTLEERLGLIGGQVDADELDFLAEGDVTQPEVVLGFCSAVEYRKWLHVTSSLKSPPSDRLTPSDENEIDSQLR